MPWKETSPVEQRLKFALEALGKSTPFAELCRQFGISPKTGYKWVKRFEEGGIAGLNDQSRRPRSSPDGLPENIVCRLVELKCAHPDWGARKILRLYAMKHPGETPPSESSIKRVMEKAGLVEKRVRRRPAGEAGRIQTRRQATAPNQVWTTDFKGWWLTTDSRRCEPLTIRDSFSRFIFCADPLENSRTETVRARFEKVFETYGLPEMIRSDNGSPFASANGLLGLSALSVWWLSLGIGLDRIDPGRPDQNGAHERMHRDISLEVERRVRGDLETTRAALGAWRQCYNTERPHESLKYTTPSDVHVLSPRPFEGTPERLEYPDGYAERKVMKVGTIRLGSTNFFISSALRGWNVGLYREGDHLVGVWFGRLRLGAINERTDAFIPAKAVEMPP